MRLDIYNEENKKIYKVNFSCLTDLYNYLISNPAVNSDIFSKCASQKESFEFAGEPFRDSVEYCIKGYSSNLDNFLKINNNLKEVTKELSDNRKMVRGLYSGIPVAPLVAMDVSECMVHYDRQRNSNIRNIYYNTVVTWETTTEQIINKGLIALFIARALEEKGDMVNFYTSLIGYQDDEIVEINVNLKNHSEHTLDIGKLYFPIVRKEFSRRILFRVLESIPVENNKWGQTYGKSFTEKQLKEYYRLSKKDMMFNLPNELGIDGNNIYDDAINTIMHLNLEEQFDIDKIKKAKQLSKKLQSNK